jgi:lipoprotein NlpI
MKKALCIYIFFALGVCAQVVYGQEVFSKIHAGTEGEKLYSSQKAQAEEAEIEETEDKNIQRFEEVIELLQNKNLTDEDRASLLFEKASLMFETFGPLYLRTATESLLEAIKLEPDKKEFRDYLLNIYDEFWRLKDLDESDEISVSLRNLRDEVVKNLIKQ